jgi:hypothetical protein
MSKAKFLGSTVAVGLTTPFVFAVITHPTESPPDAPSKIALLAAQNLATGSIRTRARHSSPPGS